MARARKSRPRASVSLAPRRYDRKHRLFDPLDRISQGHIAVDRTPGLGVQADHAAIAPFLFAECPAPRPGNR